MTLAEHRMENARRALADHVVLLVDSRRLLPSLDLSARSRHLRAVVYGGAAAYASTPSCIRSARNPIPTQPEPAHPRARHDRVPALLDDRFQTEQRRATRQGS